MSYDLQGKIPDRGQNECTGFKMSKKFAYMRIRKMKFGLRNIL